jgi:medium-chain acyl-[acyl-carrier-protein] hydrolase
MPSARIDRWIFRPRPNPQAVLRLLCFPYAGGGAAVFRTWPDALPRDVEVLAIELPGRGIRSGEPAFDRLAPLVTALADAVAGELAAPFAIYGHSLGSLVGFAFAHELRRRGLAAPVHLFASGRRAPQIADREQALHVLPDPELCAWLRRMGGVPEAVFREPELLAYFLPILRADLAINHHAAIEPDVPLSCPITAMGGIDDERAPAELLDAWRAQTTAAFDREMFSGGHFFLQTARTEVLGSLSRRLARITRPGS